LLVDLGGSFPPNTFKLNLFEISCSTYPPGSIQIGLLVPMQRGDFVFTEQGRGNLNTSLAEWYVPVDIDGVIHSRVAIRDENDDCGVSTCCLLDDAGGNPF